MPNLKKKVKNRRKKSSYLLSIPFCFFIFHYDFQVFPPSLFLFFFENMYYMYCWQTQSQWTQDICDKLINLFWFFDGLEPFLLLASALPHRHLAELDTVDRTRRGHLILIVLRLMHRHNNALFPDNPAIKRTKKKLSPFCIFDPLWFISYFIFTFSFVPSYLRIYTQYWHGWAEKMSEHI